MTQPRLFLKAGAHKDGTDAYCAMELSAFLAGEKHSDSPQCVDPAIAAFMRRLNDRLLDAERQDLVPYCIRVLGTNTGRADTITRGFLFADWAVRIAAPRTLEYFDRPDLAAELRAIAPITDRASAQAAHKAAKAVQDKADSTAAAYDSADVAAAYADAASASASAAASAAYASAAASAAYASADAYAYAADAASAAAAAARKSLWQIARADTFDLLDRVIAVGDRTAVEVVPEREREYVALCATENA